MISIGDKGTKCVTEENYYKKSWPSVKLGWPLADFLNNSLALLHYLYRSDRSWLFIKLLYHILRTYNSHHLSWKFNSWQLKHTHISDILITLWAFWRNYPMCWCHSLTLRYATRNSSFCLQVFGLFAAIVVSFLTYLFIFTPDKVSLIFRLSLTSLFCAYIWS